MKLEKGKVLLILMLVLAVMMTGCSLSEPAEALEHPGAEQSNQSEDNDVNIAKDTYPITIDHAFGQTVIREKPQRVASISWGNQDVPLALGIVPVGVSMANYGVADDSGLLPWTAQAYQALGVDSPVLFNDLTGLDYEAINDVQPDVILAAYSGITQEEYDLLSQIAPVVAYPDKPWQTFWRDQIIINAKGMGLEEEGHKLVSEIEAYIDEKTAAYSQIKGKKAAFFWFSPNDLGKFYVYLPADPRAMYLTDLGMTFPESVLEMAGSSESFALEMSAENIDLVSDVDIIITYGSENLLQILQEDALVGTMPAVQNGAVAVIPDGTPLAASGTPSALSIYEMLDEYLNIIGKAAEEVK